MMNDGSRELFLPSCGALNATVATYVRVCDGLVVIANDLPHRKRAPLMISYTLEPHRLARPASPSI